MLLFEVVHVAYTVYEIKFEFVKKYFIMFLIWHFAGFLRISMPQLLVG